VKIEDLWAKVPAIKCQGKCQDSCGPIVASPVERKILRDKYGFRIPLLSETAQDVATGRVKTCPMLVDGRCSCHESRPLICRAWGVVDHPHMRCPHGCEIEGRMLTNDEAAALLYTADRLPVNQLL
jgi:Fe-S-cluster containining protein